jgi:hypothetical protein
MELPAFLFFLFIACLLSVGGIFIYSAILIWQLVQTVEGDADEY